MLEWKNKRFNFYIDELGVNKEKLRFQEHGKDELAHYAKEAWDIEYELVHLSQIGKAFRNEIIARNFIFRTREFEQMEMQYFVKPGNDDDAMLEWKNKRFNFYIDELGVNKEKLRFQEHGKDELAHYAKEAWDIEYEFPFGWSEVEGVHNRTDFDLKRHQ
jgi:glycyl-tRNA synthetase (class II)